MTPPILLLLFNRPDLADRVFSCIREAQPEQLFIAVDGPRLDCEGEEQLVLQNQAFADRVDWPCKVETLFRGENLGCGKAVSEAITWFFQHVEKGIILEDDCLPDLSFFPFAAEMLERYADEDRISMVNGTSYSSVGLHPKNSYYYSMFDMVWGWASWKRAWESYDFQLTSFPGDKGTENSMKSLDWLTRLHLNRIWRRVKSGKVDTWDYQWEHAIWASESLVITPSVNLISNIGFDDRATHTSTGDDGRAERATSVMAFPLVHPEELQRDLKQDKIYERERIMSLSILLRLVVGRIRRVFGL